MAFDKHAYYVEHAEHIKAKSHERYLRLRNDPAFKARRAAYAREWARSHPERSSEARKRFKRNYKTNVFNHYGGTVCVCCGEQTLEFLTIDHINGGGRQHREEIGAIGGIALYRWLRKNNYPDGFQVLCFNCNCTKGRYGYCPHARLREDN